MNRHQRRQAKACKLSDEEIAEFAALPVVPTPRKKAKLGSRRSQAPRFEPNYVTINPGLKISYD
jgi:hypothetical protein